MNKKAKAKLIKDALLMVNQTRSILGLKPLAELPHGVRFRPAGCPLARALNVNAGMTTMKLDKWPEKEREAVIKFWGEEYFPKCERIRTPPVLRDFVSAFDNGDFPEFDKEAE